MTEPPDGFLLVQVGGGSLQPPDADHLPVQPQRLLPGDGGGGGRPLVHSVQLVVGEVKGGLLDMAVTGPCQGGQRPVE